MAQEFTINSTAIESKINQLLPSQGGFGAGVDFSASTMVIPIVDLTETAEGSDVRQDLQTALSHTGITTYSIANATTTVLNTTGYFRFFGNAQINTTSVTSNINIVLNDGATSKSIYFLQGISGSANTFVTENFDFIVYLRAGDSVIISTTSTLTRVNGSFRQIADIDGNLVNP